MQKNDVYKTEILKKDAEILRVLKIKEGKALVVDCVKSRMPWWISQSDLNDAVEISEDDLLEETGMCLSEDISAAANRVMHKRGGQDVWGQHQYCEELSDFISGLSEYSSAGTKGEGGREKGTDAG